MQTDETSRQAGLRRTFAIISHPYDSVRDTECHLEA